MEAGATKGTPDSQISKAEASLSNGLISYPGHSLVGSYPSAEMQYVFFTTPANSGRGK